MALSPSTPADVAVGTAPADPGATPATSGPLPGSAALNASRTVVVSSASGNMLEASAPATPGPRHCIGTPFHCLPAAR